MAEKCGARVEWCAEEVAVSPKEPMRYSSALLVPASGECVCGAARAYAVYRRSALRPKPACAACSVVLQMLGGVSCSQ